MCDSNCLVVMMNVGARNTLLKTLLLVPKDRVCGRTKLKFFIGPKFGEIQSVSWKDAEGNFGDFRRILKALFQSLEKALHNFFENFYDKLYNKLPCP